MGYVLTVLINFLESLIGGLGAHLTISLGGIAFFALPAIYYLATYTFVISQRLGVPLIGAVGLAVVIASLLGLFFTLAYRKLSSDSFAILGVSSVFAVEAVVKSWDSMTGGVLGIAGIIRPVWASSLSQLALVSLIMVIILLFLEWFFLKSPYGRGLLGLRENKILLESLGLSGYKLGSWMIIIASVLITFAGILTAWRIQFLDPSFGGMRILIYTATIGILALKPKLWWLIGAVFIVSTVPELLRFFDLPSTIMGHLRVLFYVIILLVTLRGLQGRLAVKRFV